MHRIKPIAFVFILLALAALVLALSWRALLTPEQKLRLGYVFDATEDLRARAERSPDDPDVLSRYVSLLVKQGNLGRAMYLADMHGVQVPESESLEGLRVALKLSADQQALKLVYRISRDPAAEPYRELPLGQVLLYAEGFQHAVLGDWASARNFFATIEPRQLPPPLRAYHLYYLARSYRLAGTEEERQEIDGIYEKLLRGDASPGLKARARYNMAAWYLSRGYPGADGEALARSLRGQIDAGDPAQRWAAQKLDTELAQFNWDRRDDDPGALEEAWALAWSALRAAPGDMVSIAPAELLMLMMTTAMERTSGPFPYDVPDGGLPDLAESLTVHGVAGRTNAQAALRELDARIEGRDADILLALARLQSAVEEADSLRALVGTPRFNALPAEVRAQIRFEYAEVLARARRWNDALGQYRVVADLRGPREAEALYARYAVLKAVQSQLDLNTAIPLLEQIAQRFPDSRVAPKAIEELLPLLIYSGRRTDAGALARRAAEPGFGSDDPALAISFANLRDVAHFWLAYLGGEGDAQAHLGAIERGTWNYYEVVALNGGRSDGLDVRPGSGPPPNLLAEPESAGEYLAGLGLVEAAREHYTEAGDPDNQLLMYHTLRQMWRSQGLSALQWNAMQLLESGRLNDPAVERFALELAYPMPYGDEVAAAAAASGEDPALIYAVMKKESDFRPAVTSSVGAQGLMQLMPATARMLSGTRGLPADAHQRLDEPAINIRLGAAYLSTLRSQLAPTAAQPGPGWARSGADSGIKRAMLHSYNAGPGNYGRWRGLYPHADAVLLADLVPNEENEGFAKRVWKYYLIYKGLLGE